jgi:hypothetical protein
MLKSLKILMIFSIVGISGCAATLPSPFCPPDRPEIITISNDDKFAMYEAAPSALEALAINQERLQVHIETIEEAAEAHNEQFTAECL